MWARTLCPLLSSTRNMALGSGSTTLPSTSMAPSFLAMSSAFPALPLYQTYWARTLLRPRLWAARSRLADKHRRLHARDRPPLAATARSPDVLWAWKPAACAIDQLTHPATDTQTGRGTGRSPGRPGLPTGVTTVALSVLDLVPVNSRNAPAAALRFTTELARQAERWGYRRFWVAEHHNMPAIASSAPAVLIAHLAAATSTIRVGSGGVMLPNHAPLVVAEQFGTLEALHPGRIDLGLGRAPGTDGITAVALRRSRDISGEDFPRQVAELLA